MTEKRARTNPVFRVFEPVVRAAALLGGYGILALAFLVGLEVIARKLFSYSLQGVDEIGGYIIAAMATFGFSFALLHKAHTRIDIFTSRLTPGAQALLNAVALLALAAFACFMAWRGAATLADTLALKSVSSTPLRTPLWIPQIVWAAGLVLFGIVSAAVAAHAIVLARHGSTAALAQYGPKTLEEEVEEETVPVAGLEDTGQQGAAR
jgi:TRAP-type C4-dicarboxylate transport system permease small subunit